MRRLSLISAACLAIAALTASPMVDGGSTALAQSAANAKSGTGLPLPRFVSLKAKRVNLRIGPGRAYAVAWLYTKPGVPMEVIQEYDNWRRVRDAEGTEGWVYQSLLSGRRTGIAAPWKTADGQENFINMHREGRPNADIVARLEPGVVVEVDACDGSWCEASADGVSGYIAQSEIWGAYPGEAFN